MDLPVVTVSNFMENYIVLKRANSNLFYFIDITNKLKLVIILWFNLLEHLKWLYTLFA